LDAIRTRYLAGEIKTLILNDLRILYENLQAECPLGVRQVEDADDIYARLLDDFSARSGAYIKLNLDGTWSPWYEQISHFALRGVAENIASELNSLQYARV
jgi:hypothetical protein